MPCVLVARARVTAEGQRAHLLLLLRTATPEAVEAGFAWTLSSELDPPLDAGEDVRSAASRLPKEAASITLIKPR